MVNFKANQRLRFPLRPLAQYLPELRRSSIRCNPNATEFGFTLLELLVTLALTGLLIGMGIICAPTSDGRFRLHAAAESITIALRIARVDAITHGKTIAVSVDPVNRDIEIGGIKFKPLPTGVSVVGCLPNCGVSHASVISLFQNGSASGGPIILEDTHGLRLRVDANWLTGGTDVRNVPSI